jgi:hypothetical protein
MASAAQSAQGNDTATIATPSSCQPTDTNFTSTAIADFPSSSEASVAGAEVETPTHLSSPSTVSLRGSLPRGTKSVRILRTSATLPVSQAHGSALARPTVRLYVVPHPLRQDPPIRFSSTAYPFNRTRMSPPVTTRPPSTSDSDITKVTHEVHRYKSTLLLLRKRRYVLPRPNKTSTPYTLPTHLQNFHTGPAAVAAGDVPSMSRRNGRKKFTPCCGTHTAYANVVLKPFRPPNSFRHVHKSTRDPLARQVWYTRHYIVALAWEHHNRLPSDRLHGALTRLAPAIGMTTHDGPNHAQRQAAAGLP